MRGDEKTAVSVKQKMDGTQQAETEDSKPMNGQALGQKRKATVALDMRDVVLGVRRWRLVRDRNMSSVQPRRYSSVDGAWWRGDATRGVKMAGKERCKTIGWKPVSLSLSPKFISSSYITEMY